MVRLDQLSGHDGFGFQHRVFLRRGFALTGLTVHGHGDANTHENQRKGHPDDDGCVLQEALSVCQDCSIRMNVCDAVYAE